jgi:PAS domain S-box-containing protein
VVAFLGLTVKFIRKSWWLKPKYLHLRRHMKASVEKQIGLGFIASVVALLGISLLSCYTIESSIQAQAWVTHTYEVIATLEQGRANLTSAETAQRAYLLTGDERFFQDSSNAQSHVNGWMGTLRQLTSDNSDEQKHLDELQALITQRLAVLNARMELRREKGLQAAADAVATREGAALSHQINQLIDEMQVTENQLLLTRQLAQRGDTRIEEVLVVSGGILASVLGWIAFSMTRRDLRLREQTGRELQENRARLQAILDNMPAIIYLKDLEGRYLFVNRQFLNIDGLSSEQVIGKTIFDITPRKHAEIAHAHHQKVLATQSVTEAEETTQYPDGLHTHLAVKFPIRDAGGKVIGTGGISTDITERKANEEERQRLTDELKRHATQLELANKELEAFSYSVSHDLRAPLRHIDGFVKLLDKNANSSMDERSRRFLDIIADSTHQMGVLIDDLLMFSRMGRSEMRWVKIESDALIHEVVDALQSDNEGRNIEWKIAKLPQIQADAPMLRQVWANLIGNAVKYTRPRDPARIEIGCNENGTEFVFYIGDNGVGFDMQYAHKLFGVFQRLHRVEEFEGTGIGLANVQRIVLRHHGRVWAEGRLNEGSKFFFTIPKQTIETKG